MDKAADLHDVTNEGGLGMAKKFTYKKTVDSLKEIMKNG